MRRAIPWIGVIVLAFVVYAQSLGNDFVTWDDRLLIVDNPIVHGLHWSNIVAAFTSYDPELYIPLTFLSYQVNYAIHGLQPFGYHLVNLLLHTANTILVYGIVASLTNAKSITHKANNDFSTALHPLCVALLFAAHPLHTEAVVWAAARKDVLSAWFFLLAVLLYVRSNKYQTRYWWSVAMFALALLSKVSVLAWPLLIPLLDWYRGEEWSKGTWKRTVPYFGLSIIFGAVALGGKIANTGFLWEKILIGCRAVTLLLQKFFWPAHLSALYPFTQPIGIATPALGFSVLFVAVVSVAVLWLAWKNDMRLPIVAWAWFLLLLAPSMSNIFKGHNELLDIYVTSDRYAYLPSVGLFLAGAWGVGRAVEKMPRAAYGTISLIVLFFCILTYRQSLVWNNTLTLFTHVSAVQPNSYVAWNNIGTEYVNRGRLNDGLQAYSKALAIRDDATTWYNVGQILRAQGKNELAMQAYENAVRSSPLEADALRALGELRMESGE